MKSEQQYPNWKTCREGRDQLWMAAELIDAAQGTKNGVTALFNNLVAASDHHVQEKKGTM